MRRMNLIDSYPFSLFNFSLAKTLKNRQNISSFALKVSLEDASVHDGLSDDFGSVGEFC